MPYNSVIQTLINKPLGPAKDIPTDARSYFYDTILFKYRPYQSKAEVLSYLDISDIRKGHFPIFVNETGVLESDATFTGGDVEEYWFRAGIDDSNLELKLFDTKVKSVFGRQGVIVAETGDYSAEQVTNAVDSTQLYSNPVWIDSLAYSKITGGPKTLSSVGVSGSNTKTITLTFSDATTLTAQFTDLNDGSGGPSAGVSSFNGRSGVVLPIAGDYTTSLITEGSNLYFTEARVLGTDIAGFVAGAGTVAASDTILQAINKIVGNVNQNSSDIILKANIASPALTGIPTAPTVSLSDNSTSIATTAWVKGQGYGGAGTAAWGSITGVFSDQTDAYNLVVSKQANILFRDEGSSLGSTGTVSSINFVGSGVSASRVGNDLTVTVNNAGLISSVFGRTGAVTAQLGDYNISQITNGVSTIGTYSNPTWITNLAWSKLTGVPSLQPLDSDLTSIAALSPADNDFLQRKAGSWTSRTISQVKSDLAYTKADIGLPNAENTSDLAKPVSTATQTALNLKVTANTAITPGTNKTKVSYDAKGLIISGTDATTSDIAEGSNQYYTNARARAAITLTTTGTSGPATYNSSTGILNIPDYDTSGGGGGGTCDDVYNLWMLNLGNAGISSGTKYVKLDIGTVVTDINTAKFISPISGTLKDLFIIANGIQPAGGSLVFTLMKGTATSLSDTALTVTIAANTNAGTGTTYSDTTHDITVNAGDVIALKAVSGISTSLNIMSVSMAMTN